MDKSKRFEQGQEAGRTVYQDFPDLTIREQAEKAYEQLCRIVGEDKPPFMGEERSDFMGGFGSGYYLASQLRRKESHP
jgi:hypothetical protein